MSWEKLPNFGDAWHDDRVPEAEQADIEESPVTPQEIVDAMFELGDNPEKETAPGTASTGKYSVIIDSFPEKQDTVVSLTGAEKTKAVSSRSSGFKIGKVETPEPTGIKPAEITQQQLEEVRELYKDEPTQAKEQLKASPFVTIKGPAPDGGPDRKVRIIHTEFEPCRNCKGKGKLFFFFTCPKCNGSGRVPDLRATLRKVPSDLFPNEKS